MISINEVRLSPDLDLARVYYTPFNDAHKNDVQQLLDKAAGFLRSRLGQVIEVRKIPQLVFVFDNSLAEGLRMDALISGVVEDDERRRGNDDLPADPEADTDD